jgi:hypothetical protein
MRREAIQETNPALLFENTSKKEQLLKYNGMSIDELLNEQANIETDLSNGFFDILFQNNIDIAQIDSQKTMDHVINEYIADGKIDETSPQTVKWLEKNTLSRTLENIIRGKQGEQEQSRQNVDQEKINKNVDRIRAITNTLRTLTGIDQMATKESLIEINTLIDQKKNLDAYNLSKKVIRDLESKYKLNLEQQKEQIDTNYDLLLAKAKIAEQIGLHFPPELVTILSELTEKAKNEYVSNALQITNQMNEFVDGWMRDQEGGISALLKIKSSEKKLEKRDLKKFNTVQQAFQRLKTEAKKASLSESGLPLSDIQTLLDQSDFDAAMNHIDEAMNYVRLTKKPEQVSEKKVLIQNPLETPLTQTELEEKNLEYAPNTPEQENTLKDQAERVFKKTQERLDYAVTHPDTLSEKEETLLRNMMRQVQEALDQNDLKKAESGIQKLSKTAALLAPLETDHDYTKNLFNKKARKESSFKRKQTATFVTAAPDALFSKKPQNNLEDVVLPETIILPKTALLPTEQPPLRETKVARRTPTPRPVEAPVLPITEKIRIDDHDVLESTTLERSKEAPPQISETAPPALESSFDDTEPFIEDEEPETNLVLSKTTETSTETRPVQPANQDYTPEEKNFFERGSQINEEHQALAQEKRGFFGRVFDKFRPSFETPEDRLIRTLQKEKWLQNIPKMSHKDVLVSLKKFGIDLTGGAVETQLKHVAPLLRSNSETGEVFKALWDKYLETQVHEKKKWEEAIPTMDIDRVYLNLEKFGINPDEDGRRDVKAKIASLANEPGKRGDVFQMLYGRYVEIQKNNIRALERADQKHIIQFLKTGYKIDPTHYFEDTKNEKILKEQKQIEELRTEYSTRGKVIDAAMKRLEELQQEKARAKIKSAS